MPKVFFAFRDAPERRAALRTREALDRYRLFGLDEVAAKGAEVSHNLERSGPPFLARMAGSLINRALTLAGGYGGDFASILGSLRTANAADVVLATADPVGIPLLLLKRIGLVRPPVVYAAIGLPERLVQLRGSAMHRLYRGAFRDAAAILAYSETEADWLRAWLGSSAPPVHFVPFGVDVAAFSPDQGGAQHADVVSVGADPYRDFELLRDIALRQSKLRFVIVATAERARSLGELPANVDVDTDVPLETVRERLAQGRVVALPVRANSYSGATTTLLQALALAKPVVVSRTAAIAQGYGLEDGVNCSLVEPGDGDAFERALLETLADPGQLGSNGRELVVRELSWQQYTERLWEILSATWARERS
jgi:glycosyltransferase involved in cell wall biosynthesis